MDEQGIDRGSKGSRSLRFRDFSVMHSAIWLAVRMSQMSHCIGF